MPPVMHVRYVQNTSPTRALTLHKSAPTTRITLLVVTSRHAYLSTIPSEPRLRRGGVLHASANLRLLVGDVGSHPQSTPYPQHPHPSHVDSSREDDSDREPEDWTNLPPAPTPPHQNRHTNKTIDPIVLFNQRKPHQRTTNISPYTNISLHRSFHMPNAPTLLMRAKGQLKTLFMLESFRRASSRTLLFSMRRVVLFLS